MTWTPNSPKALGLEWLPTSEMVTVLDSPGKAFGAAWTNTGTPTLDTASCFADSVSGTCTLAMELSTLATSENSSSTLTVFRPNEDVSDTNVTGAYTAIDEASLNIGDYLSCDAGTSGEYRGRMGVGSGNLAGRRVLSVQLVVVVGQMSVTPAGTQFFAGLNLGSTDYLGFAVALGAQSGPLIFQKTWELNPSTNLPWTIAEVEALDTSDEWYFTFVQTGNPIAAVTRVYQAYLSVATIPENRVAFGYATVSPDSGGSWITVEADTPGGSDTVSLVDATDYVWIIRKVHGDGSVTLRSFDSGSACPHVAWRSYRPTIGNGGIIGAGALGAARTDATALVMTDTSATLAISQPYKSRERYPVFSGEVVEQEITEVGSNSRSVVAALVATQAQSAPSPLTVKVKLRSSGAQSGGTQTLASTTLTAPTTDLQPVFIVLPSAASMTSGQYYVEFTCAAASGSGWVVGAMQSFTKSPSANTATMGGTTDQFTATTGGELGTTDACMTLHTQPDAPTGVGATVIEETYQSTVVEGVDLAWTVSALGSGHARTQVYRSDDGGTTYVGPIFSLDDDSIASIPDWEAKRGSTPRYRFTFLRDDTAESPESSVVTATLATSDHVAFVSNEAPSFNCAWPRRLLGECHFTPGVRARELVAFHDRDYAVAYIEDEIPPRRFSATLRVAAGSGDPPDVAGWGAYDALVAMANAGLSYVCVHHLDDRLFGTLEVSDTYFDIPTQLYLADIVVTQTRGDDEPSSPTAVAT